jgi:signal transduction histidine kinase
MVDRLLAAEGCSDVPVVVDVPSDAARVQLVDRRRLEQSVGNLLRNAAAHGGGAVAAGVAVAPASVVVFVEDHGPGVAADEREAVFQRFFRGSASGRRSSSDGVGLGLALVHEQARLHGGQTWVEEVRPTGARFVIQLPRRPVV